MHLLKRVLPKVGLAVSGALLYVSGGCVPENLWADILGATIIDGTIAAFRNTILVGAGLETP